MIVPAKVHTKIILKSALADNIDTLKVYTERTFKEHSCVVSSEHACVRAKFSGKAIRI